MPEVVPNTFPDLFWCYTAVWTLLVVYILTLGARLSKSEKTLSEITRSRSERPNGST